MQVCVIISVESITHSTTKKTQSFTKINTLNCIFVKEKYDRQYVKYLRIKGEENN